MGILMCEGSFSCSSSRRPAAGSAEEEPSVVVHSNANTAEATQKEGVLPLGYLTWSPLVTKVLLRGAVVFSCILIGFFFGTLHGPLNHSVTLGSGQRSVNFDDFPVGIGFHTRRLSHFNGGADDGSGGYDNTGQEEPEDRTGGAGKGDGEQAPVSEGDPLNADPSDMVNDSGETAESGLTSSELAREKVSDSAEGQTKQHRRKKRFEQASGPDPHTYRSQLCTMLRLEPALQEWYALLVLYVAEWPTYARHGNGGDAYIENLRNLAKNFEVPRHAAMPVQVMFAEEHACGTPSFFLNGLNNVAKDIHRHHDLIKVMRTYSEIPDFADLVDYTQVTKLPADASISGFPMLLRTAFEGFSFCFSRKLFIKGAKSQKTGDPKEPTKRPAGGSLTMSDLYKSYVREYQQNQFQYWLLLMMASVMKRIVSSRPHAGIMVLKFDSAKSLGLGRRGSHDLDQVAIDSLQRQVAVSVEGKLDRSLQRFQTFQSVQSPLVVATSAMRPNVSVTGYLERAPDGNFVDHGIFGMDMESDTLEALKLQVEPGNLLVDVSLVDPWSSRPLSEWPDPLHRDLLGLTAYTATQLLCAELQWDPSLGNLGHVEVVYSGFTDVYDSVGGGQQPRAKFDPDVQVLLLRDNQKFVEDGLEDGSKKKIAKLVAQEPLQWGKEKVIDADRIEWRGIARLLKEGQMYRRNAFGMGLPPALRRGAERVLKPNVVLIHVAFRGLGHLTPETLGFDMTANEMAGRLVRRSRGIYDAVLVKAEAPVIKEMAVKGEQKCVGEMPKWVVLVASLSVALFFIILITLLLYHEKIKLPWWIMCICSSRAPWEGSSPSQISNSYTPEIMEKHNNSTRDIIAFAPSLKETSM